ncbi:MAG: acyl-CoA synthetase [Herminiimonas sp.]|nr:acyl-CoA synthetase [Herminiimonas sp.]
MPRTSPYSLGLDKTPANFTALSPISFLAKTAAVYPDRIALIHGQRQLSWAETYTRCRRLASALQRRGIGTGDTVAVMAPNIPATYEASFGVPMAGAVLNTLNIRLDAEAIAFQLAHSEARILLTDREFSSTISGALALMENPPLVIDIDDVSGPGGASLGETEYEALLEEGDPEFEWQLPADEWDAITLNYTSGTTGNPKGVVYHHRGAYLNALSNIVSWGMPQHSVYLWTLPMFHCNGWCFPWTMAANAGTNVCLRRVDATLIFDAIRTHRVTHMCAAPIVYNMMINAPPAPDQTIAHGISGFVAGSAPPATTIEGMERLGFDLTHVYGLTETYGPAALCAKQQNWGALPPVERASLNARQGVASPLQDSMAVLDPQTLKPVPRDGQTIGEIMFRGNITMKGYLKNPIATAEAFEGGWFHTGDLAIVDPDGYVSIRDRSKDVIISGGENISSIEVENLLYRHPAVEVVAVVAKPDAKWGEVPWAFVQLKPESHATEIEILDFCRSHLARFKVPKAVVFGPIPKTSTGKLQKFLLREQAREQASIRVAGDISP